MDGRQGSRGIFSGPEEVTAIDGLDRGESGRIGPHPDRFDWIPEAR